MKKILVISSLILGLSALGAQAADKLEVPTSSDSVPAAETVLPQDRPNGFVSDYQSAKEHAASLKDNAKSPDFFKTCSILLLILIQNFSFHGMQKVVTLNS